MPRTQSKNPRHHLTPKQRAEKEARKPKPPSPEETAELRRVIADRLKRLSRGLLRDRAQRATAAWIADGGRAEEDPPAHYFDFTLRGHPPECDCVPTALMPTKEKNGPIPKRCPSLPDDAPTPDDAETMCYAEGFCLYLLQKAKENQIRAAEGLSTPYRTPGS